MDDAALVHAPNWLHHEVEELRRSTTVALMNLQGSSRSAGSRDIASSRNAAARANRFSMILLQRPTVILLQRPIVLFGQMHRIREKTWIRISNILRRPLRCLQLQLTCVSCRVREQVLRSDGALGEDGRCYNSRVYTAGRREIGGQLRDQCWHGLAAASRLSMLAERLRSK